MPRTPSAGEYAAFRIISALFLKRQKKIALRP
jgi:hypothetical protein